MLMNRIAEYTAAQRSAPLSDEVRHHTRRAILDWYAALIAGSVEAPATLMRVLLEISWSAAVNSLRSSLSSS